MNHCVYCGWQTSRNTITCRAHRDLPGLDPHYNQTLRLAADVTPTRLLEQLTAVRSKAA